MSQPELNVNVFTFEELAKETIQQSTRLMEYFKLNIIYYQLVSGKGLEFDRIKEYSYGDDAKRIDWKALARTGELHTRSFKEERHFDIVIVIDVSDSMLLGTSKMVKNEFAALIAGVLAYAAIDAGDEVAIVMSSSKVSLVTEPEGDFYHMLRHLTMKENYGGEKNWQKLVGELITNYDEQAIIFLISDFIDTQPEEFLAPLSSSFTKTYGIMVRDKVDDTLPEGTGAMYLADPTGKKSYLTDFKKLKEEYEQLNKRQLEHIRHTFLSEGQLFFKVRTDEDFASEFIRALGHEKVIE